MINSIKDYTKKVNITISGLDCVGVILVEQYPHNLYIGVELGNSINSGSFGLYQKTNQTYKPLLVNSDKETIIKFISVILDVNIDYLDEPVWTIEFKNKWKADYLWQLFITIIYKQV